MGRGHEGEVNLTLEDGALIGDTIEVGASSELKVWNADRVLLVTLYPGCKVRFACVELLSDDGAKRRDGWQLIAFTGAKP